MDLLLKPSNTYKSACFELNRDLYDLMEAMNYASAEWVNVHKLTSQAISGLGRSPEFKSRLMHSPILCVLPVLKTVQEWQTLFTGDAQKLAQGFSLAPTHISPTLSGEIRFQNKFYLNHIIMTARTSPLSMLELGVPFEIIELLKEVTVNQKNNASGFKLPLFKWRYTDLPTDADGSSVLSETDMLYYFIQTTPSNLLALPSVSNIAARYHSESAYPLAEHLVRFNMRATIITTLMPNLHAGKIRDMYQRLVSNSSSCGKLPSSYPWYFTTERRRAHSSFLLLLYRLAIQAGTPHIHSIIASYGWYLAIAPEEPLPIDRFGILVNAAQSGSGMVYVAACRNCDANHLLCNTEEKQEFSHHFHCEPCRRKRQVAA